MDAWLERTGHPRGAVLDFETMWALARPWYEGRLDPGYRGRTPDQAQAIVDTVGLSGDFWRMR